MIRSAIILVFVLISVFSWGQSDTLKNIIEKQFDSRNVLIYEGTLKNGNYFNGKEYKFDEAQRPNGYTIWKEGVPEDSLRNKIQSLYLQVLADYFQDTVGDKDAARYGFNFVVSEAHSLPYEFLVNGKPFKFDNPPYHDLFVGIGKVAKENKGRRAYFLDDNFLFNRGHSLPDTLEIVFSDYVFTGMEGRKGSGDDWEKLRKPIMKYRFVAESDRKHWRLVGIEQLLF